MLNNMKKIVLLVIMGLLTLFTPIYTILWLIIIVTSVDLITAIHRDFKKQRPGNFFKNIKIIKSRKLRRTFVKTTYYLLTILLLYAIPLVCFDAEMLALWITRVAAFTILSNEMFSIGENIGIITGDNIINKIIRNSIKKMTEWTNKQIEDKKDID